MQRSKFINVIMLSLSTSLLLIACNQEKPSAETVALVNSNALSREDVKFLADEMSAQNNGNRPVDEAVIKELIRRELLRQEADREGLTNQASYKVKLANIIRNVGAQAGAESFLSKITEVSDNELRKIYDDKIANNRPKQFRARQIVLASEVTAKAVMVKLQEGSKFEDLAKTSSIDTTTRDKGGEVGWFSAAQTTPLMAQVLANMINGELSAPIHGPNGWHIIQLEDTRKVDAPTFDAIKEQLKAAVKQERLQKHVSDLEEQGEIKILNNKASEVLK
jgi:peptidyl-prolyl cis-trans isomerase C